jgi:hypothetical protein
MKTFVAVLGSLLLLAIAAFCVFGFMATFEPTDRTAEFLAFRVGYAVVGVGCLVGVVLLIVNAMRRRSGNPP